ncbi:MAG: insulinase family protein, partial [Spirochaetales bacterium]|nr:insulinase family protein [Spirochaetales bacterium]
GQPENERCSRAFVVFRMKTLNSKLGEALRLVTDLITGADFSDSQRMRDILFEFRNDVKAQILPAGSSFTALRAGARISPVLAREELWKGIEQVLFLYKTADNVDSGLSRVCEMLTGLRKTIMNRNRLTLNLTAEGGVREKARDLLADFVSKLPSSPVCETGFRLSQTISGGSYEAVAVPSMVGYVSTVFPASSFMSGQYTDEVIIAQLLKTGFLWEQVRMRGGAYGVTAATNGVEMLFSLSSYRDPNIADTLDAYRAGFDWLISNGVSGEELEKAIIGIVGRELRPLSPGEKGIIGFRRRLYDISDDLRQRKRDELLASDAGQIREAARKLRENLEKACSVVMSGEEALSAVPGRYSALLKNKITLV